MLSSQGFLDMTRRTLEPPTQSLKTLVREEESLHDHELVKTGFLLHNYKLKEHGIKPELIGALRETFERSARAQVAVVYAVENNPATLTTLEQEYTFFGKRKLKLKRAWLQAMRNAGHMTALGLNQIQALENAIAAHDEKRAGALMVSIEKMTTQILVYYEFALQVCADLENVEAQLNPSPRMYGRAMSKKEVRETIKAGKLLGSPDETLVPVFDCPQNVRERIEKLPDDGKKGIFEHIGVRTVDSVIFFTTRVKPVVGPVRQKNGLFEYKLPKGTPIEFQKAA